MKELTLDRFIDCYCNNNLSRLVKIGEPPLNELEAAWEAIQAKYVELIGGDDFTDKVNLITTIQDLSCKVEMVEALIEVLAIAPTEGLFLQLYNFGYNLPSLPYNEPNIERLCRMITAHMKRDVAQIQVLTKQLDEQTTKGEKVTEEIFYKILVEIGDVFKIVLKESETSVMAFAMYVRKYKEKADQLNAQQQKRMI